MTLALRIANAFAEARLRAHAALVAGGIAENQVAYRPDGGLDVGGKLACLVMHSRQDDVVHVDVVWALHWEKYGVVA